MHLNLLIIITIFCWGIWGILDKKALDHAQPQVVMLMFYLLEIPICFLMFLLLRIFVPGWHLNYEVMLWTGLASFTQAIAFLAYLSALNKLEASYVLGITAGYPLILQFLAVPILGESLVLSRVLGAALIGLGIAIVSGTNQNKQPMFSAGSIKNSISNHRLLTLSLIALATLCWGIWGIFDKKAVAIAPPFVVYFAQCLWDCLLLLIIWIFFKLQGNKLIITNKKAWQFCALSRLSLVFGAWAYLIALSQAPASYVIAITGCYPLLMYIFAIAVLKEHLNHARLAGITIIVAGGLLVQWTQSIL